MREAHSKRSMMPEAPVPPPPPQPTGSATYARGQRVSLSILGSCAFPQADLSGRSNARLECQDGLRRTRASEAHSQWDVGAQERAPAQHPSRVLISSIAQMDSPQGPPRMRRSASKILSPKVNHGAGSVCLCSGLFGRVSVCVCVAGLAAPHRCPTALQVRRDARANNIVCDLCGRAIP